jgi:uncharacterized membrane protein YhaH (DUF805 family)
MKLCSQCEKENPSSANHCMYCGTALVEEEQLSEEAKLLKKLKEQDEENRLLKAALEAQLKQQKTQENIQKPAPVVETVAPPPIAREVESQPVEVPITSYSEPKEEMPEPESFIYLPIIQKMFSLPFSFKGRIRRLEYGISCIIYFVWYVIAMAVLESDAALWAYLSFIPAYWFMLAQGAKRCHDRNNSGWYQIIPFYGLWMLFAEGDDEENDYGFPPK